MPANLWRVLRMPVHGLSPIMPVRRESSAKSGNTFSSYWLLLLSPGSVSASFRDGVAACWLVCCWWNYLLFHGSVLFTEYSSSQFPRFLRWCLHSRPRKAGRLSYGGTARIWCEHFLPIASRERNFGGAAKIAETFLATGIFAPGLAPARLLPVP